MSDREKKAYELFDFYYRYCGGASIESVRVEEAKECATKVVNEIAESLIGWFDDKGTEQMALAYWKDVQVYINNIKQES